MEQTKTGIKNGAKVGTRTGTTAEADGRRALANLRERRRTYVREMIAEGRSNGFRDEAWDSGPVGGELL